MHSEGGAHNIRTAPVPPLKWVIREPNSRVTAPQLATEARGSIHLQLKHPGGDVEPERWSGRHHRLDVLDQAATS